MTKWAHRVGEEDISQKSSAKKRQEEIGTLEARLNALGAEGWELVPYGARPMTGTFTNNIGYAYLSLFQRPGSGGRRVSGR